MVSLAALLAVVLLAGGADVLLPAAGQAEGEGDRGRPTETGPCAKPMEDADGDGLLNGWECGPVTFREGRINLAALGADPEHKDIFVECDYMQRRGKNLQPLQDALDMLAEAFAAAPVKNPDGDPGVTIHIDAGSRAVNLPAGLVSRRGNPITYVEDWGNDPFFSGEFDAVRRANFPRVRARAFYYCVFANNYADNYSSGLARNIPARDFLLTLGGAGWGSYPRENLVQQQAGTFMHELGHGLGLQHGGPDSISYKPNYFSVMNYPFQLDGLIKNGEVGEIDYSRFKPGDLNENALREGVGVPGPLALRNYGTLWSCPDGSFGLVSGIVDYNVKDGVDWNCSGKVGGLVSQSINNPSFFSDDGSKDTLRSWTDWEHIIFINTEPPPGGGRQIDSDALVEIGPAEAAQIRAALEAAGLRE